MKEKNLIIGMIVSVIILITVAVVLIIEGPKIKTNKPEEIIQVQPSQADEDENKVLIATIENKAEEDPEYRDATIITQDILKMGQNVGKLVIPKTNLETEVYCKQDANKMEEVPCMLYTNEGPNQPGVTILVGHNRNNNLLFSNNKLLEENDEFYFTDYITNQEKKYKIYSKFVTESIDVSFYNTPSDEPVIGMQCCLTPTDSENVLIILAKAEE